MIKTKRVQVNKVKSRDYQMVAENFIHGANLAKEFEYWNAAGVLIVHAAIAYADAITIKVAGLKSRGEDHLSVVRLLEEIVHLDETGKKAIHNLRRIIEEKSLVSYSGEIYSRPDIERLWKILLRFRDWAVGLL